MAKQKLSRRAKDHLARQRGEEKDAKRKAEREGRPVQKRVTLTREQRAERGRNKHHRHHRH